MRILVTGGAGFIGSHLCEYLVERGHHVICLDNMCTGSRSNVEHLLKTGLFEITPNRSVTSDFDYHDIDQIYHLASRASPVDYQKFPVETMDANLIGTKMMLEQAMKNKARILFTSTSEVYGDPKKHPQNEDYHGDVSCTGPRACYDNSKRGGESYMGSYHRQYGVDIAIARIFNTYGPRLRPSDGRVISNFIVQSLNNRPLTVYGDGSQTRSFCYISDMVEGLYMLMNSAHTEPKNIGNPHEVTVLELAKKIKRMTRSKSEIVFAPLPEDDPTKRCPDISRARRMIAWEPRVTLDEGLRRTIEWFKKLNQELKKK